MKKKIHISIVGTGLMGLQHIKAISKSKKAKLHSIVDISKNAANLSKKFKIPLYATVEEVLKSKNLSDFDTGTDQLAQISKSIYDYMIKN